MPRKRQRFPGNRRRFGGNHRYFSKTEKDFGKTTSRFENPQKLRAEFRQFRQNRRWFPRNPRGEDPGGSSSHSFAALALQTPAFLIDLIGGDPYFNLPSADVLR